MVQKDSKLKFMKKEIFLMKKLSLTKRVSKFGKNKKKTEHNYSNIQMSSLIKLETLVPPGVTQ
jgi:hypothetical protein